MGEASNLARRLPHVPWDRRRHTAAHEDTAFEADAEAASRHARSAAQRGRSRAEPLAGPALEFSRTDIDFRLRYGAVLDVAVRLRNPAPTASEAGWAIVEFAPFGAFLPWTPAGRIRVPSLQPGESRTITASMPRPALGGAGEPPGRWSTGLLVGAPAPRTPRPSNSSLLGALRSGERIHFAGNLNVHIGATSVERHLSGPLRLHPGMLNAALFFVGSGGDAYRFELAGDGVDWSPSLFRNSTDQFALGQWYDGSEFSRILLLLEPPPGCRTGKLEVHVEQHSTGSTAVVEFSFDEDALDSGCYTL